MKNPEKTPLSRRALIQNGVLVASGCAWAPWVFSEALYGQAAPGASNASQSWTVSNDRIKRTVTFEPAKGLFTEQLSDLSTHADFILPGPLNMGMAQEFSFECSGHHCAGSSAAFNLVNGVADSNQSELVIHLRHKELPLEVSVAYSVYSGHPAIRKHLVLHNAGTSPLRISHLNIEAIGIALGPADETTLLTQYGTIPRETFYTGRSEDAGLLIANARTGNGVAVISEVPGYMKRTEIEGFYDPERVRIGVMYDTDLMPFERVLAAGETFATACVSLIAFRNGDGFNDPHWALPSYTAQVLERRVDKLGPPWIYNTWEPFNRKVNHDLVLELVDAAGAMGMDIFTIDDGWQQEYGENAVNLTAFPGGLDPILQVIESKGMRLGLWIPLAAIGTTTADYRQHPEWAALDQEDKPKITGTAAGPKAVMCMASAYREAAAARVIEAVERFRLAYVKLDLTTIFNAYGEAPGCWAKGHDHGSWAESLGRIYEGISYVTGKIYEKHPDVLLDLTFELWGQKHIVDAGLLAAGDLDWLSNVGDKQRDSAGPVQARQLLYQRAASMPVESMLIGNIHAELPTIQESFATAMGSAPVLLGDLRKLSAADRQWYHEKIAWFKKLRRTTKISESFFPLGSWLQTSAATWDGFARMERSGNGVIALFRNKSDTAEVMVRLPLMPAGKYKVRSVVSGADLGAVSNSDWARGVKVRFAGTESVEIFEVNAIA
ncbi:MAG TPA: alpha-galactosidase [Terracidiphilus sp.]|jgi:alpha-galactosidase|nr:alpha-galactosidase [Terracidiphilus sp.]